MDLHTNKKYGAHLERQLANLKLISRLLAHELHSQGGAKSITLSREEVTEVKPTLDLFIEEIGRRQAGGTHIPGSEIPTAVGVRNN